MREYRKLEHLGRVGAPTSPPFAPSVLRAPEPSGVSRRILERPSPQAVRPNSGFALQDERSSFKNALELARLFHSGCLVSRVHKLYQMGRPRRSKCPRNSHATWKVPANRPDAVGLVLQAERSHARPPPLRPWRMVPAPPNTNPRPPTRGQIANPF